ncbi:hypothetical protein PG985_005021 [Apiospora marii]|uniref:uncharacterized protein n=1 Tax=Apiospora marii TaxID=335849 RepID=UPI0031317B66
MHYLGGIEIGPPLEYGDAGPVKARARSSTKRDCDERLAKRARRAAAERGNVKYQGTTRVEEAVGLLNLEKEKHAEIAAQAQGRTSTGELGAWGGDPLPNQETLPVGNDMQVKISVRFYQARLSTPRHDPSNPAARLLVKLPVGAIHDGQGAGIGHVLSPSHVLAVFLDLDPRRRHPSLLLRPHLLAANTQWTHSLMVCNPLRVPVGAIDTGFSFVFAAAAKTICAQPWQLPIPAQRQNSKMHDRCWGEITPIASINLSCRLSQANSVGWPDLSLIDAAHQHHRGTSSDNRSHGALGMGMAIHNIESAFPQSDLSPVWQV